MIPVVFDFQWITDTLQGAGLLKRTISPKESSSSLRGFSQIVTDSRKTRAGDLFVALKGDQFDGNDFLMGAAEKGASGVLGSILSDPVARFCQDHGRVFFEVTDSTKAFRALAKAWRSRFDIPIAAVIGNVGKTTTKELLSACLLGKYDSVLKTQASQNGFLGIPMTLLELRESHDAAVIEIGIDEPHTMDLHMDVVQPTHLLLTSVGEEHLEKLGTVEQAATEEIKGIAWMLKHKRPSIFAAHQDLTATVFESLAIHPSPLVVGFGLPQDPLVSGLKSFKILKDSVLDTSPLPGSHNQRNCLGAVTLAKAMGLNDAEIKEGLTYFTAPQGRSDLQTTSTGILVLCDYYNSNPASLRASLELFSEAAQTHRRWLCLGDMLELGPEETRFHQELKDPILKCKPHGVLLFGPRMKTLLPLLQNQVKALAHFSTHDELSRLLLSEIKKGDAILLKGSRGMKMEKIWERLQ